MSRVLQLFWVQARTSTVQAMAYRANFIIQSVMSLFMICLTLLPLIVCSTSERRSPGGTGLPPSWSWRTSWA